MCIDQAILFKPDCPVCRNNIRGQQFYISSSIHNIILKNLLFNSYNEIQDVERYVEKQNKFKEWENNKKVDKYKIDVGDCIDVRDTEYVWCKAVIKDIYYKDNDNNIINNKSHLYNQESIESEGSQQQQLNSYMNKPKHLRQSILVHYEGWSSVYDQVISLQCQRISQYKFYTSRGQIPHYNLSLQNGQHLHSYVVTGNQHHQDNNFIHNNNNNVNYISNEYRVYQIDISEQSYQNVINGREILGILNNRPHYSAIMLSQQSQISLQQNQQHHSFDLNNLQYQHQSYIRDNSRQFEFNNQNENQHSLNHIHLNQNSHLIHRNRWSIDYQLQLQNLSNLHINDQNSSIQSIQSNQSINLSNLSLIIAQNKYQQNQQSDSQQSQSQYSQQNRIQKYTKNLINRINQNNFIDTINNNQNNLVDRINNHYNRHYEYRYNKNIHSSQKQKNYQYLHLSQQQQQDKQIDQKYLVNLQDQFQNQQQKQKILKSYNLFQSQCFNILKKRLQKQQQIYDEQQSQKQKQQSIEYLLNNNEQDLLYQKQFYMEQQQYQQLQRQLKQLQRQKQIYKKQLEQQEQGQQQKQSSKQQQKTNELNIQIDKDSPFYKHFSQYKQLISQYEQRISDLNSLFKQFDNQINIKNKFSHNHNDQMNSQQNSDNLQVECVNKNKIKNNPELVEEEKEIQQNNIKIQIIQYKDNKQQQKV